MLVLVTYDVNVSSPRGQRRLRRVAKACVNHGQRVQQSVFECKVDPAMWVKFKATLESEVDPETDSLRYYFLGKNWHGRIEHFGVNNTYDPEGPLIV